MDRASKDRITPARPRRALMRLGARVALVALITAVVWPSLAQAQGRWRPFPNASAPRSNDAQFDRPGLYIGGGLVGGFTTRLEGELTEIPGVNDVEVDPSFGLVGKVGARITPRVALEARYEWMEDFETSFAGNEIAETTTSTVTADVKGYLGTGRIQPYLSAGAGFLRAKSDDPTSSFQKTDTDFAARFGGGVDFYLTEVVGLSLDTSYVVGTGDVENLDYVSVGAGVFLRF